MTFLKRLLAFITLSAVASAVLASCNTTRGFGRDVEHVGRKIEQKAS